MSRHEGTLPQHYIEELEGLTDKQIAYRAAKLRGQGRYVGTSTALVLRWFTITRCGAAIHKGYLDIAGLSPESKTRYTKFFRYYNRAWSREKEARKMGYITRPRSRPVIGGRRKPHEVLSRTVSSGFVRQQGVAVAQR